MESEQINLIRRSWQSLASQTYQAGALFYERLFVIDPSTRPLFKGDIQLQAQHLVETIDHVVKHLHEVETLVPVVQDLGRRHLDYGVTAEHYDTVGSALFWTLDKLLGDDFDVEVCSAWAEAYTLLANTMKQAAGYDEVLEMAGNEVR